MAQSGAATWHPGFCQYWLYQKFCVGAGGVEPATSTSVYAFANFTSHHTTVCCLLLKRWKYILLWFEYWFGGKKGRGPSPSPRACDRTVEPGARMYYAWLHCLKRLYIYMLTVMGIALWAYGLCLCDQVSMHTGGLGTSA